MSLLADVLAFLERHQVPAAVIGGVALAAHGIARATLDTDLFVVDARLLSEAAWADWTGSEQRDVFRGDDDESLAGSVRLSRGEEVVDIVVGRPGWQAVLDRRQMVQVGDRHIPIVDRADLILLKLLAAGPQDLVDVELLVASDPSVRREVEARLATVPAAVVESWRRLPSRFP
jgi:hypothetical protein